MSFCFAVSIWKWGFVFNCYLGCNAFFHHWRALVYMSGRALRHHVDGHGQCESNCFRCASRPQKAKENHFKIFYAMYPSNDYLHNKVNIDINTYTALKQLYFLFMWKIQIFLVWFSVNLLLHLLRLFTFPNDSIWSTNKKKKQIW